MGDTLALKKIKNKFKNLKIKKRNEDYGKSGGDSKPPPKKSFAISL